MAELRQQAKLNSKSIQNSHKVCVWIETNCNLDQTFSTKKKTDEKA